MLSAQELPGSELPCYCWPFLELHLPDSAIELTVLEPPGSWLLGPGFSVPELD